MRTSLLVQVILLIGHLHGTAHARVVDDLYKCQTVVTGTEEPERTRGFRETFEAVLVKLTGNTKLAGDPRVLALAEAPHRFVETFAYEDRMKDIPVHDEQGTRERPHFLRVTFSRQPIDEALKELGVAKWEPDRPVVAVWLAVETAAGRFVLSHSGPEGYGQRAVITETALRLGLPIALPAPQQSVVEWDQVATDRLPELRAADPAADAHLAGRLTVREDGFWNVAWSFHGSGLTHRWTLERATFDAALKLGLSNAVNSLSGSHAK